LDLAQVSTGGFHSCGVTTSHRAYCWGNNIRGQIGDGTNDPSGNGRLLPVPVAAPM
jgi:alpha-tubulin suppressor-like RCC1 family protein